MENANPGTELISNLVLGTANVNHFYVVTDDFNTLRYFIDDHAETLLSFGIEYDYKFARDGGEYGLTIFTPMGDITFKRKDYSPLSTRYTPVFSW